MSSIKLNEVSYPRGTPWARLKIPLGVWRLWGVTAAECPWHILDSEAEIQLSRTLCILGSGGKGNLKPWNQPQGVKDHCLLLLQTRNTFQQCHHLHKVRAAQTERAKIHSHWALAKTQFSLDKRKSYTWQTLVTFLNGLEKGVQRMLKCMDTEYW